MINRRLFNTALASIFTLPALKNLPTPVLDQKQTELLKLSVEHVMKTQHLFYLEFPFNKRITRGLKFIGDIYNWDIYPSKEYIMNFKVFNSSTKEAVMPSQILLGEYYDIKIYDSYGIIIYYIRNLFFKSYSNFPNYEEK